MYLICLFRPFYATRVPAQSSIDYKVISLKVTQFCCVLSNLFNKQKRKLQRTQYKVAAVQFYRSKFIASTLADPDNKTFFSFSFQPPDEVRAAWKTPPISPVRPLSASRRRDPDPGGASNARGDESSRSTRPGRFVSKLRAEAQLASSGVTSVNRPLHVSNSDGGLSSWSASVATATTDQGSSGHAARSKSG